MALIKKISGKKAEILKQKKAKYGVISVEWVRRGPLTRNYRYKLYKPPVTSFDNLINERIEKTETIGEMPLWSGYKQKGAKRDPSVVKTNQATGRFYTSLVQKVNPDVVVEFGTAFGVSGMYWVAGLELNKKGTLHTFEINKKWADVAEENLKQIGKRFKLYRGLFEDKIEKALNGKKIDIAFVDGVHTSEWVYPQFEIVAKHLSKGGIIILDDIDFSEDMEKCWEKLSVDPRVASSAKITHRVGLIEFK